MPASKTSVSKAKLVLHQQTLSFASSKRTASSTNIGKAKPSRQIKPSLALRSVSNSSSSSNEVNVEDVFLTSDEDVKPEEQKIEGRPNASVIAAKKSKTIAIPTTVLKPKDSQENIVAGKRDRPELLVDDPKWRKHHALVRQKMNHMRPIHSENQNKIHEILRVFDLSYEYGPCIGVTRLERWERAQALGLNPPIEVHEILITRQGAEQTELSQPVFNAEV